MKAREFMYFQWVDGKIEPLKALEIFLKHVECRYKVPADTLRIFASPKHKEALEDAGTLIIYDNPYIPARVFAIPLEDIP